MSDSARDGGRAERALPGSPASLRLHVAIGPICNNNCIFCMEEDREGRREVNAALTAEDVRQILEELAALSDKIRLTVHEFAEAREAASRLKVDKIPGVVIRGPANRAIKFYGIPSGSEFPGLIEGIVDASRGKVDHAPEAARRLKKLREDVTIQVLVTPT